MKRAAVAVAVALVLLLVYGVAVEARLVLDEREITAELPGLDASWEGEQVAVFSDLQTGMWLANTGMVERVVDRVVEVDPAAVLLVGDFVYGKSPQVPEQVGNVVELLRPIPATGSPAFAVLGNHDYAVGAADELTAALEELGVEVLLNDAVAVPSDAAAGDQPLYVVGLGPTRPDLVDVDAALDGVPDTAARITMLHNPTSLPRLPARSAPLAVAGHTHCVPMTGETRSSSRTASPGRWSSASTTCCRSRCWDTDATARCASGWLTGTSSAPPPPRTPGSGQCVGTPRATRCAMTAGPAAGRAPSGTCFAVARLPPRQVGDQRRATTGPGPAAVVGRRLHDAGLEPTPARCTGPAVSEVVAPAGPTR